MARPESLDDYLQLAEAQTKLLSSNPHQVIEGARQAGAIAQRPPGRIDVSMRDNIYRHQGHVGDYEMLRISFPRLKIPTGRLILKGTDPLSEIALTCSETVVPIVVDIGPLRWSGRIDVAHDRFGDPTKPDTVECELLHDKAWLTRVVAFPWWFMPIQVQGPPSKGVAFGNAITVIKYLFTSQFLRIQLGLWEVINNLLSLNLDWRAWFGTLIANDANPLDFRDIARMATTPVYVIQSDYGADTSPFISLQWKMEDLWSLVQKTCEDNGLTVEVFLWEPGMPQPDEFTKRTNLLKGPTICIDVKDRMGVTGFSGTWLDGIQRTFVDITSGIFGEAIKPLLNPGNTYAPDGVNIAPALGLHWTGPWTIFNADHPLSGVRGVMSHHSALAWRTITGGKSPKWLNDMFDALLSWVIDMIMIVIGFTGVPGTVLDGAFSDMLFAFQLTDNFPRRIAQGPFGFPEKFQATGSGSYTLEGWFAQKSLQYDTRGYVSGQLEMDNCFPHELGRDWFPGGLATVIRRGRATTDFVEDAVLTDTRDVYAKLVVQVGDGKAEEAPETKIQRRMADLLAGVNTALMSS